MHIGDPILHLKLQEMCDCYLETDFLVQLERFRTAPGPDPDDDAMRYLALAIMYTVTEQAAKLSMKRDGDKIGVTVKKEGDKEKLPAPPASLFARIAQIVKGILHLEGGKGESQLSLGLRNGSVEMRVKMKEKDDETELKFEFGGS